VRIAIVESLPPGGARRASFELGRFLAGRHVVDLYQLDLAAGRAFDLGPFVNSVYRFPFHPLGGLLDGRLRAGHTAPRSYVIFGPLMRMHHRMADDIRRRGYDAVLAHTDPMTQSPHVLRWLRGIPSLYYCQEVLRVGQEQAALATHRGRLNASRPPLGALRAFEDRFVLARLAATDRRNARAAAAIAVNSVYSRERVWAAYARPARVCRLGVDADRFAPSDTPRRFEVVSVGGPAAAKGHDLTIEALARLPEDRRPALRVVVPDRGEARELERLAAARRVPLHLEERLDEAAMAERYQRALATVCAARLEPFGLTALESMACATPVVAIEEAGFRESVLDRQTGLLVDPEPDQLAQAIASLAGNPSLAANMGLEGRRWILAHWRWEDAGARIEGLLAELAAQEQAS
jgi:glycosyltransferase involved in cell wall biosynthesis